MKQETKLISFETLIGKQIQLPKKAAVVLNIRKFQISSNLQTRVFEMARNILCALWREEEISAEAKLL